MLAPRSSLHAAVATAAALLVVQHLAPAQSAPASSAPAPLPVTFFGEVRTRSEWDRPGSPLPSDAFTYLRSRFGARVDAAPGARLVLQVQDSRVLGAEGRAAAGTASFDLHQGYVELSAPWRGVGVTARAGRQEIALANERLVGAVGWSNVGRSFDGVRLMLAPAGARAGAEPWTATAFAATVEERGRHFGGTTTPASDHAVAGLHVTRALGAAPTGPVLEGTALYDAGASYRAWRDADRATLDARLRVPRLLGVRAELEGAVQVGRQHFAGDTANLAAQDVRAWLVGARVATPTAATGISAALGVDVLSGDATPGDGRYGAFSTMYATNHPFYGVMDVVGDPAATTKERGLVDALATAGATLSPTLSVRAELHRFALATGDERALGWEADVTVPVRLGAAAGVELGYSAFRAGPGGAAVGLGDDGSLRHWAYLQLRASF